MKVMSCQGLQEDLRRVRSLQVIQLSLSLYIYIYIYTYIHIHNEECGFGRNAKPGSVWRPATTHGQARTSWDEAWAPYSGSFLPESGPIRLAENASEWRLLHPKRAG